MVYRNRVRIALNNVQKTSKFVGIPRASTAHDHAFQPFQTVLDVIQRFSRTKQLLAYAQQFLAPASGRPRDTRQHSGSTRDPHKGYIWFTCCKHKVLYVLNLVARQYLALFADNARGSPLSCDLPNVHLDMFSNTCSLTFYKRL
eukprot:jgi/Botrbrau1/22296/Bobra.0138s0048.1